MRAQAVQFSHEMRWRGGIAVLRRSSNQGPACGSSRRPPISQGFGFPTKWKTPLAGDCLRSRRSKHLDVVARVEAKAILGKERVQYGLVVADQLGAVFAAEGKGSCGTVLTAPFRQVEEHDPRVEGRSFGVSSDGKVKGSIEGRRDSSTHHKSSGLQPISNSNRAKHPAQSACRRRGRGDAPPGQVRAGAICNMGRGYRAAGEIHGRGRYRASPGFSWCTCVRWHSGCGASGRWRPRKSRSTESRSAPCSPREGCAAARMRPRAGALPYIDRRKRQPPRYAPLLVSWTRIHLRRWGWSELKATIRVRRQAAIPAMARDGRWRSHSRGRIGFVRRLAGANSSRRRVRAKGSDRNTTSRRAPGRLGRQPGQRLS